MSITKQTAQVFTPAGYLTLDDVRVLVESTSDFPADSIVVAGIDEDLESVSRIDLIRVETEGGSE